MRRAHRLAGLAGTVQGDHACNRSCNSNPPSAPNHHQVPPCPSFPLPNLQGYFDITLQAAAVQLGVGVTTLKKASPGVVAGGRDACSSISLVGSMPWLAAAEPSDPLISCIVSTNSALPITPPPLQLCRQNGLGRWPYRARCSLRKLRDKMRVSGPPGLAPVQAAGLNHEVKRWVNSSTGGTALPPKQNVHPPAV